MKNFSLSPPDFYILIAVLLDAMLGEPSFIVHPVVLMGKMISSLEKKLRKIFSCEIGASKKIRERLAGTILVVVVCAVSFGIPFCVLKMLKFFGFTLFSDALSIFWGYQCVAARCLRDEALNVRKKLSCSLEDGRSAVARIVGRETKSLDKEGVIKATVESVAESTTDGIFSPIFFFALGGAPLSLLYKAINTMDSMLGYKNERYRFFGTAAARLDDIANFIPARLAAFFMLLTQIFSPGTFFRAARIFFRDRYKHESPNSAQTESVMAGILGVRLGGNAVYEGKIEKKETLGDDFRKIEQNDIDHAVRVMYAASVIFAIVLTAIKILF